MGWWPLKKSGRLTPDALKQKLADIGIPKSEYGYAFEMLFGEDSDYKSPEDKSEFARQIVYAVAVRHQHGKLSHAQKITAEEIVTTLANAYGLTPKAANKKVPDRPDNPQDENPYRSPRGMGRE